MKQTYKYILDCACVIQCSFTRVYIEIRELLSLETEVHTLTNIFTEL